MGLDKVTSIHNADDASSDFVKSAHTNDYSNPQQGTGATKISLENKHESFDQNKKDQSSVPTKSNSEPPSRFSEDRRKLFVGGLPTDITDPEFRNFFSQFGELHESIVMFDRETRRSRGFGFVTYVNPDVAKSLLQMGNHGDGIGRLVMRGKTCEVKAAAPKGQAPHRGGKPNRNNRGGPRNQQQPQVHQVSFLGHSDQFPAMHQINNYNMVYPEGAYSTLPGTQGYAPPVYHIMPPPSHPQNHAPPHVAYRSADCDPRDIGIVGTPYFFTAPIELPPPDCFSVPHTFTPTPQLPANFQHQGYAFVPFAPDAPQMTVHVPEVGSMTQQNEQSVRVTDETNNSDEGAIEVEKE